MLSALIIIGSLSITITSILYWIWKGIFKISFGDTLDLTLMFFFFGVLMWILLSTGTTQERGAKKLQKWFDSKLGRLELRTRRLLRLFFWQIGVIASLGTILFGVFSAFAGEKHTFFVDILLVGLFLIWFSPLLISDEDVALVLFRRFRNSKTAIVKDLEGALHRYNKSIDFRLSREKLSAITQYVRHAYSLNLEEAKNKIDAKLCGIIKSLETKQYGRIPQTLSDLSVDSTKFFQKYSSLGMEIQFSLWTKTKGIVVSLVREILPKLFYLLILIAIYLILNIFLQIQISIP